MKRMNSRPTRFNIPPVLHIDGIHLGKVIHIRQEHSNLEDLGEIATGGFENVSEVFDALMLLFFPAR